MKPALEPLAVSRQALEALIERAPTGPLGEADCQTLRAMVETLCLLKQLLDDKTTRIARLKRMLFGSHTETTENVLPAENAEETAAGETESAATGAENPPEPTPPAKKKGHGRKGANAYTGAARVKVNHPTLAAGDPCPSLSDRQGLCRTRAGPVDPHHRPAAPRGDGV